VPPTVNAETLLLLLCLCLVATARNDAFQHRHEADVADWPLAMVTGSRGQLWTMRWCRLMMALSRGVPIMAEPAADVGAADVSPLRSWIVRHPIATFLVLVYATTTALVFVPRGLTEPGLLPGGATSHRGT
jgi:hypothetical protein